MSLASAKHPSEAHAAIYEPPITFHKFTELPNELKDIIWRFALTPQLVRFQFEDSVTVQRDMWAVANELIKTNPNDAILSVCRASRDIAMKEYLRYTLTTMTGAHPPHSYEATCYPPVPFFFRPWLDTIYVPRVHEFVELVAHTNIIEDGYEDPPKALESIRSLALGGVVEKAWYLHRTAPLTLTGRGDIHLDPFMDGGSQKFWHQMSKFPSLEELIIVVAPIYYLTREAESIDMKYFEEIFEIVICSDPIECGERVKDFQQEVEKNLARGLRVMIKRLGDPNDPLFRHLKHQSFSDWWRNPKVTMMTESEFRARFNRGELPNVIHKLEYANSN